jgi:hypothetical protein
LKNASEFALALKFLFIRSFWWAHFREMYSSKLEVVASRFSKQFCANPCGQAGREELHHCRSSEAFLTERTYSFNIILQEKLKNNE